MIADHYPWNDAILLTAPPGVMVPAPESPHVQRFKLHYMTPICQTCHLAAAYCACARQSAAADADRDTADLDRRARECRGAR